MTRDTLIINHIASVLAPIVERLAAVEARLAELENWRRWTEYSKHPNPVYAGGDGGGDEPDPPPVAADPLAPASSSSESDAE